MNVLRLTVLLLPVCLPAAVGHAALISLYTFDDGNNNAVVGAPGGTPEGPNGRYRGPQLSVTDGPVGGGRALKFDGLDDSLNLTTDAFPRTSPFGAPSQGIWSGSAAFWMKTPDRTREHMILGAARLGDNTTFEIMVYEGRLRLHVESAGSTPNAGMFVVQQAPDATDCCDDRWHHVILTWNLTTGSVGTGSATIYVDGERQTIVTLRNDVASTDTFSPWNWPVRLGGLGRDKLYEIYYFQGVLDDLAVWNEPLSETKLSAIFNLATDKALNFGIQDVQSLVDIFEEGPGSQGVVGGDRWKRTAGNVWKYATGLSGSPCHVVGHHDAVVLDNQGNGMRMVPRPMNGKHVQEAVRSPASVQRAPVILSEAKNLGESWGATRFLAALRMTIFSRPINDDVRR